MLSLLFTLTPPVIAQPDCYVLGQSSFCNSVNQKGQLQVTECYWMSDNKFCRIDDGELNRVY